ncbi:SO_0444 family Cu/Zn efflux transporter [Nitratifractor sp.]|uniref:SO_0444 family Cu/Zn efflux transporter n=1 Tax=Nitratifractor sp. TaxID=2268144 RepID=UPI0025EB3695|nr:SO_0444 family Cu/Zn efflux transporter [Nitratifractor sp.]
MKTIILNYLENFWQLLGNIAPYILLGIFLAGLMKLSVPEVWIRRQMGGRSLGSLFRAILLGIPLPLCSCSVIPFATALRKSGASRASTLGFLIATPITGVDSIIATYGVLGWFFTLYRVITSTLIAILAGLLSLIFDREESTSSISTADVANNTKVATPEPSLSFAAPSGSTVLKLQPEPKADTGSCGGGACCSGTETASEEGGFLTKLWEEAVYRIFGDFAKALLIGIALGALLVTFMPAELNAYLGSSLWLNYLLVLLIAAPLYICATSSIPLGVALLGAGFSPGAVFVFLTAGPATSTVTMSVVLKILGRRSLLIYLLSVVTGTLLFGWIFDVTFAYQAAEVAQIARSESQLGFLANVSALLLLYLAWKVFFPKASGGSCCSG